MTTTYADDLRDAFLERADPAQAIAMAKYMRDQFAFFGLKKQPREAVQKAFWQARGLPDDQALGDVVKALWRFPERECQYAALAILSKRTKPKRTTLQPSDWLPVFEDLIVHKSWWDTVDWIAAGLVGWALRHDERLRDDAVARYRDHDDMWLRRTALIFQLKYKGQTDAELLFSLCEERAHEKEFFIRKAVGWALREYSKTDGAAVQAFVAAHPELSGLSRREALKWLQRQRDKKANA